MKSMMVLAGLWAVGCGVEKLDDTGGDAQVPAEIQRILVDSCGVAPGCHTAQAPALGIDLTTGSMSAITAPSNSGLPLVELGNVDNSEIALQVLSGAMPLGMAMDPVDKAILLGWIAGAQLPSGTGGDDGETTDDGGATEDSGGMVQMCGIDDLVTANAGTVDAGTAAGQIPPDIGDAIARNCGCHFGAMDDLVDVVGVIANPSPLGTLADLQANRTALQNRLMQDVAGFPAMPPLFPCAPTGEEGVSITVEDQDLLLQWFAEDPLPDGADWTPPG